MKKRLLIPLFAAVLLLSSCAGTSEVSESFFAMDTVFTVTVPYNPDAKSQIREIEELTKNIEKTYSKTIGESTVSRFNASSEGIALDEETYGVLSSVLELSAFSEGAYDPTVDPLVRLWGFGTEHAKVPNSRDIADTLSFVDYRKLSLENKEDGRFLRKSDPSVSLDLGGAVKGYACAAACEALRESCSFGRVNFGGTVGVFGQKPDGSVWKIGMRDPDDASALCGTVELEDGYVAVSGDYERFFEENGKRYCHILDPQTGYPPDNGMRCCAVVSHDGLTADVLSTALFLAGYDRTSELYESQSIEFDAVFVYADGSIRVTPGLAERFVPSGRYHLIPIGSH